MSIGDVFRRAVRELASKPLDDDWSFSDLKREVSDRYPGVNPNRKIAELAGYPPVSKASDPEGFKRRKSFMRSLQRWSTDAGEKRRIRPEVLRRLAREIGSTSAPGTIQRTLTEMARAGVEVVHFRGGVRVSSEKHARIRDQGGQEAIRVTVFIDPDGAGGEFLLDAVEEARGGDWERAAEAFARAWGLAYGIGTSAVVWEYVDVLELGW